MVRLRTLLLIAGALALLAGCGHSFDLTTGMGNGTAGSSEDTVDGSDSMPAAAGSRFGGTTLSVSYAMPDVTLTDTSGHPFNLVTDTTDTITLLFFGYTHCPDVCPLVMSDLAVALTRLPPSVRAETQVVFVTTDPARDTPSVIRSYLDRYNPSFVGLTGPMPTIRRAADDLQVAIDGRMQLPGGGYDIGHGAQVIGFVHDVAPVVWMDGTPVSTLVADISKLARR